jgi:hypothetical protein
LKGPRDKVYAVVAFTAIGVGVLGVANGVYRYGWRRVNTLLVTNTYMIFLL